MRILISNDDGIHAPGLRSLWQALFEAGHELEVYAPDAQQSGASSRITTSTPLRIVEVRDGDFFGHGVKGTPADSVMLGLSRLDEQRRQPDLIVAGINRGPNVGMDVLFSGTVGAAAQGALAGIPSIAVSNADFQSDSAEQARHLAGLVAALDMARFPRSRVLNVNYPNLPMSQVKGVRLCPHSTRQGWSTRFEERCDPFRRPYWWMASEFVPASEADPDSDKQLMVEGYVTLTPLRFEYTDHDQMGYFAGLAG